MSADEPIKCACGEPCGAIEPGGNWIKYPNPTICKKCGTDNSAAVRESILSALTTKKGKRR